jgi:hypothetical protein
MSYLKYFKIAKIGRGVRKNLGQKVDYLKA